MPVWKPVATFWDASTMTDEDLYTLLDFKPVEDDMVSPERKKVMHERYHGIIGGADSLSIIGSSGIGKTSAIQKALDLISGGQIIEIEKPFSKIIPCLQVQCPYDASPKGLLLEILRNVDSVLGTKYYERSRTYMVVRVVVLLWL